MASGKSTIGPLVARRLGLAFTDLDARIEAEAQQMIAEIFAAEGEAGFRTREAEALRALEAHDDIVVALGGGTVVDDANRAWVLGHGCMVYLSVPPGVILDRVASAAAHRPLLQDESGEVLARAAMHAKIRRMLRDRQPAYRSAHCIVDAAQPPVQVAARVAREVQAYASRL
jgi:shikimate kinase